MLQNLNFNIFMSAFTLYLEKRIQQSFDYNITTVKIPLLHGQKLIIFSCFEVYEYYNFSYSRN